MSALHGGPRVFVMPDGKSILSTQPVDEAMRALEEAASAAIVDQAYRVADQLAETHRLMYGFDRPDLMPGVNQ